jgi:hypothetical protein
LPDIYFINLLLAFFGRGMDFLSTYIATPDLRLEANPIAKKLGWRWMIPLNIILCLLVAETLAGSLIILVASLMVSGSNFSRAIGARGLGADRSSLISGEALRNLRPGWALALNSASAAMFILVGLIFFVLPDPELIQYGSLGIIAFGAALLIYGNLQIYRRIKSISKTNAIREEKIDGP